MHLKLLIGKRAKSIDGIIKPNRDKENKVEKLVGFQHKGKEKNADRKKTRLQRILKLEKYCRWERERKAKAFILGKRK